MKPELTRRLIGALAALLGVLWTWGTVVMPLRNIWAEGFDPGGIFFLFTIVPLMAIPGILAVIFGVRLFREFRESFLKWVIGVFAVFFAFVLSSKISTLFPSMVSERLQDSVLLFGASIVAIVAYLFVLRLLIRHLTKQERRLSSLLSRSALILMAWQLWLLLSQIFDEYSPIEEGYTHVPEEPWGILGLVVPIAVAYGLYGIFAQRLTNAQQDAPSNR